MVNRTITIRKNDHVLSLHAAAKRVGLSRHGLMLAVLRGEVPARQIAGRWVVREQDADAYAATRKDRTEGSAVSS
jgi:hypothetical protein